MEEKEFWRIISLFDWDTSGKDNEIMKPAVNELAKKSVEEIARFEEILAQKLYALDTEAHARNIGEEAYTGNDSDFFSVDNFLYARCCVVAKGESFYKQVLSSPSIFPKDVEFESLLFLSDSAYEKKTGEECEGFDTSVSYETFSNIDGWKT